MRLSQPTCRCNRFDIRSELANDSSKHSCEFLELNTLANPGADRFQSEAAKYAAYLQTPEGRLRLDLALTNLQEFLPQPPSSFHALDIGGGTGAIAVRLAQIGLQVTVLDPSLPMLEFARSAARNAGLTDRIILKQGDASQVAALFAAESFDLVLCHNVLEFVDDPGVVLRDAARLLRSPSGLISILVRNQPGEVLKSALVNGDLAGAERNLNSGWGDEALYGGKVRLFSAQDLKARLQQESLAVAAERGVRVIADYLPPKISRNDEYERIFELERKLGVRPEFAAIARYTQFVAHHAGPIMKDEA